MLHIAAVAAAIVCTCNACTMCAVWHAMRCVRARARAAAAATTCCYVSLCACVCASANALRSIVGWRARSRSRASVHGYVKYVRRHNCWRTDTRGWPFVYKPNRPNTHAYLKRMHTRSVYGIHNQSASRRPHHVLIKQFTWMCVHIYV